MFYRNVRRVVLSTALLGIVALIGCASGSGGGVHDHATTDGGVKAPLMGAVDCALAFAGVHLLYEDPSQGVNAYHYCAVYNKELTQCILYDSANADARLLGIEYLVPGEVYQAMPEEEKKYWHNHENEIDSGLLRSLTQSGADEMATLKVVRTLYGKIYHTWVEGDKYPTGPAKLFYAVYGDGKFDLPEGFKLPLEVVDANENDPLKLK